MQVISQTTEFNIERPTAVTLGKFDGLHLGHQLLLERILKKKEEGLAALIFTFDFGKKPGIMLPEERRRMLRARQTDYLLECPFVPEVAHTSPEKFVREILTKRLNAKYLAVGTDFRFGYQRAGDYKLLQQMAQECGYTVEVVDKACYQGREISSTYIREELDQGHMELVAQLLGYTYSVSGKVLHGRKIGRTLGLPTVNLIPEKEKLLPPNGVYATRTEIDGEWFDGITNIGYKPTVGEENAKGVETYLFDLNRELYGKEITVHFYGFERPEQKFSSISELKDRIEKDVAWGRKYLGKR